MNNPVTVAHREIGSVLADFDRALTEAEAELSYLRDSPEDMATELEHSASLMRWLYDGGWTRHGWSAEVGGSGGSALVRCQILERLALRGYPIPNHLLVLEVVGPAVAKHAPDLAARVLPAALRGEELWSQGFSEPEAGSDLAALRTVAAPDADGTFTVNGQKIWTSYGWRADRMVLLARTGSVTDRHRGLVMLLVDLDAPGVQTRPIALASGRQELAEVFFTDVRVPADRVIGAVGAGWAVAMDLLQYERGSYAWMRMATASSNLARIVTAVADGPQNGAEAVLGSAYLGLAALRARTATTLRRLDAAEVVGAETSIDKLLLSTAEQDVLDAAAQLMAGDFLFGDHSEARRWRDDWWYSRAASIYGGAREIQHGIVADRLLSLPREGGR
ncbi:acyl-CoA dehydrogenase family protein [Mycolicibacterium fluoranthenivorans]|uniref:Acyl-CoA dehydrogenase family protein n=1 Tax=Mycolicibacterium fluoranthenivorans TaxID=258505 RepID=A0A7G8PG68_9MYCO|nr:acyl-CoA dehydrogenase family protein [Mycolicibacterium fluoranthenivorans]QNJ93334.1 acyl-CoA dehydrogenase family protein [Mycolicibacterium fluoranthenivorans]